MLDAICSDKLIQNPISRTGASGKPFTNFLLSVGIGEDQPIVVSGIAFGDASEKISRLTKGDSVSVIGSLNRQLGRIKPLEKPSTGFLSSQTIACRPTIFKRGASRNRMCLEILSMMIVRTHLMTT